MTKLIKYIIALSNLYGMVHKDKVVEIYNSQNKDQISKTDIDELIKNNIEELEIAFIITHKDYFLHEVIMENDDFDLMLKEKGDKPYYVPKKNELLKYINEEYFEKSKEYNNLFRYVKRNFYNGNEEEEKVEFLCEDIHVMCRFGVDIKAIMDTFNSQNISFNEMEQVNEVIQLVMELSNNVRIWENNGYTPNEIFEKFEKPKLKPLLDRDFAYNGGVQTVVKNKKIGRNDPCPCGSGKKYKKCCLGKDLYH